MDELITVDDWGVTRFKRKNGSYFFVVIGLGLDASGICSSRIVTLKGHDVPKEHYENVGNILPFNRPRIICRDDRGITYRLRKRAHQDEIPLSALSALLKWCGSEFKPGDFHPSTICELQEALRTQSTFADASDGDLNDQTIAADPTTTKGGNREVGYRTNDTETLGDLVEIRPPKEREMGPYEVTCLECGWVSFALTGAEAEREIESFNQYFDRLSRKDQESLYGGRRSNLASYRCVHCGNAAEDRFRPAKREDCPDGVTLNPVICNRLAKEAPDE